MEDVLQRILRTGCVTNAAGESVKLDAQVSPEVGRFLQEVVRAVRPKVSLEIGLAYGVSSLFICETLAQVSALRHIVIDPYQLGVPEEEKIGWSGENRFDGFDGIGLRNLEEAGYEALVEFHDSPSYRILPYLERQGCRIDFAFIDGCHTFDFVLVDFFYIDRLLREGGVVVFDDLWFRSVRKVCRYILTNRFYVPFSVPGWELPCSPPLRKRALATAAFASRVRLLKKIVKPEFSRPNYALGMPAGNYIALQKVRHDAVGNGGGASRRWDFHNEF